MKIYLEPTTTSRGIMRVRDALVKYKPDNVEIVSKPAECDLVILHAWGRNNSIQKEIAMLTKAGKAYAIIQYALRSTMRPDTKDWIKIWANAKLVWSYYNLFELCDEDGLIKVMTPEPPFNFYYAPLGVDSEVFKETKFAKKYIIIASSQHYLSESAKECAEAAKNVKKSMFFLGHDLRREGIVCKTGISDEELAQYYSQSDFVSGLRRVEGFELPVIEGLLCGARPIVFDRPEMRKWFGEFAIFIREDPREKVVEYLTGIFENKEKVPAVTDAEKALVKERFNWETIIKGFYDKLA